MEKNQIIKGNVNMVNLHVFQNPAHMNERLFEDSKLNV